MYVVVVKKWKAKFPPTRGFHLEWSIFLIEASDWWIFSIKKNEQLLSIGSNFFMRVNTSYHFKFFLFIDPRKKQERSQCPRAHQKNVARGPLDPSFFSHKYVRQKCMRLFEAPSIKEYLFLNANQILYTTKLM